MAFFFNPTLYAIYSVGVFELRLVKYLVESSSSILMPKLVKLYKNGEIDKVICIFHEVIRKIALISCPIFIYLLFFSKNFIIVMFTEKYIESIDIFRIYLLLIILLSAPYDMMIRITGTTKPMIKISILYLILNIILNIILIKLIGIIGAALGAIISMSICVYMWLKILSNPLQTSIVNIYPFKEVGKIFLFSFITFLPSSILAFQINNYLFEMICCAVTYSLSYYLIFRYFNIFTQDDLEIIHKWVFLKILQKGKGL